MELPLAYKILG